MSIKVDTKGLDAFADKLMKASKQTQQEVTDKALNALASETLARTIKQTPRDTSNLARGWTASNNITRKGNMLYKTIYNPVEYGVFVEYGHRTRNHRGWVPGKFMLTRALQDVEARKEQILSEIVDSYFRGLFS